jgi:hypothetical protein
MLNLGVFRDETGNSPVGQETIPVIGVAFPACIRLLLPVFISLQAELALAVSDTRTTKDRE